MSQLEFAKFIVIVIIIIIIIYIVHMIVIKKTPGGGGRITVHGTFVITKGQKSESNRDFGKGSEECFYLNDIEAPTLYLNRGVYYEFKNTCEEPLYFTTHSSGGKGAPESLAKNVSKDFIGMSNGTIYFMISDDLPATFYYHSGKSSNMGSIIIIK